jgi:transposase InsO family protein
MDFQFDATADGRRLKFLNVIDEHSRLCLAIRVGPRCKAKDVVAVLEELTSLYPAPTYIRSDNGPEFIAHDLRHWCNSSGTTTAYIDPESHWQNGFAESFNSRFRDELLNTELFATVAEVQGLADRWPTQGVSTLRPHSALQGRTPMEAAQAAAA